MKFNSNIFLMGKENSDNNLLSGYLSQSLSCQCPCIALEQLSTIRRSVVKDNVIVLIDAAGQLSNDLAKTLAVISHNFSTAKVAFFNVNAEISCDKLLLWPQVRGIFFDEVSEKNIVSGIKQIFANEYWLPRKVMAQFLEHLHRTPEVMHDSLNQLTKREWHILKQICDGFSNIEIADELHVSLSTVKTHTYNLFKKLNVSNRVQATNIVRNLAVSDRLKA